MEVKWKQTNSSFLSRLTFYWMFHVINIGRHRQIVQSDIQHIGTSDRCGYLLEKFIKVYENHTGQNHNLNNVLMSTIFYDILGGYKYILTLLSTLIGEFCYILSIECMRRILLSIHYNTFTDNDNIYLYVIVITSCQFIFTIYNCNANYLFEYQGIIIAKFIKAVILYKSLMISENSFNSSNIINIITSDAQRVIVFLDRLPHSFAPAIFHIFVVLYLCYISDSLIPLFGLFLLIFWLIMQMFVIGNLFKVIRRKVIRITDKRIKFIQDMLKSWLIIKVYCAQKSLIISKNSKYP
eukprot:345956_1